MLLNGTALVTGGGSGIGRAVALACARSGCRAITVADVSIEGLQETENLIKEISDEIESLALVVNVSDAARVSDMISRTVDTFGSLDYAFNVAGISCKARVASAIYPTEEYDDIQAVNARGLMLCTQSELQVMLKQDPKVTIDGQNPLRAQRGSIVNIASTCGSSVIPNLFPYIVSKHAVCGITKAAGIDHAGDKVRVNAVCPGLVETPMIETRRKLLQEQRGASSTQSRGTWTPADMYNTPIGRLALAEEVADACIFLASSVSSHTTASCIFVDGGRSAAY